MTLLTTTLLTKLMCYTTVREACKTRIKVIYYDTLITIFMS